MAFFTVNKISQKAFVREKRWIFYFLSGISILANLLDMLSVNIDVLTPVLYVNSACILIIASVSVLYFLRKISIYVASGSVVYLIIFNISISQFVYYDNAFYAEEFLRESLYIWMTTLIAGFLINRNHVIIIEIWHIVLLLMAISTGSPFIIDNQIMLFLAISIFTASLYYIIFLLDKHYIANRTLLETMHKDRVELRKQERRLLREDETKNRLFSIISHDLKSNSNLLLNFSILLQKRIYQKEYGSAENMCDAIYQAADNNNNLLVNLLEWTRAQSETIEFSPSLVDVSVLLNEVHTFFEQTLNTKHITLHIENSVEQPIYADQMMLSSILRNLLSNAIKFSPMHTSVKVSASIESQIVSFTVTDTGLGMPAEKLYQLKNHEVVSSTRGTSDEKGSGLGFSICRYFIDKHLGTVQISSIEGKGTTITVSIPQ